MRRKLGLLLLALIVVFTALTPQSASAASYTQGCITGDRVAMRKAADGDSSVIMRLAKGTIVEILDVNVNAQWHQVRYNGKTGYVNRMYVSLEPSLSQYQLSYVGKVVNCKKEVNVRSLPTTDSDIVGKATKGATYTVTAQNVTAGWHQIRFDGGTAYISADFLSIKTQAEDNQLTGLTVTGGNLSPSFSPSEYGYVVMADGSGVEISASANKGVDIDIAGANKSSVTIKVSSGEMKTVRIELDGKTRYTIYIVRNLLSVGTWNIKRGYSNLIGQGRLIENMQPDIMGLQEVYRNLKSGEIVDNLASLKTKVMQYTDFAETIGYSGGGQYGIGVLTRYKIRSRDYYELTTGSLEDRVLQKIVISVGSKRVSIYNTHLSYQSASVRAKQFKEIKAIMDADRNKYVILFGDFNADESEFKLFSNGYRVINTGNTSYYSFFEKSISHSCIDNIIVSDSITVVNTVMLDTKLSDHNPLFAFLKLG